MVTKQTTDAQTLARRYAELVRDDPTVRELWLVTGRGAPELWLIADQLGNEQERALYGRSVVVYDEYPDALFDLFVVSPDYYPPGTDLRAAIPKNALRIPLGENV